MCWLFLLKTFFAQMTEYKEKVYICTLVRKTGFQCLINWVSVN